MESAEISRLRSELTDALAKQREELCGAIRRELAEKIVLAAGRDLQFEVDDLSFGITLCDVEDTVMAGEWLDAALPTDWFQRAEDLGLDANTIVPEALCPWFADCWREAGGPAAFQTAYLFFHLNPQKQYDLERRRWREE
jgi:hypothetical protein